MKTNIGISILILWATFFTSCISTPDLTEDEVYTIINEIIADDSLSLLQVCWKFQTLELTDEYKKEFTKNDVLFINRQNDLFKNKKIKPNKLKWYRKHSNTFEPIKIDTACDQGILYHISFPMISEDRQKVLIEIDEDCNCMLGGGGGKDLYEKKNGHWVRTKSFGQWISDNKQWKGENYWLLPYFFHRSDFQD